MIAAGTTAVSAVAGGGTAGAVTGFNQVENNYLKHAQAAAMNAELDKCRVKTGGCSMQESDAIFKTYVAKSNDNIAQVQSCVFMGNAQCVTNAFADAAAPAEVMNNQLSSQQVDVLYGRQSNVQNKQSVTGSSGPNNTDVQSAQQVAQFRQANCADPASEACNAKVLAAMQSTQLGAVKLVGAALLVAPAAALVSAVPGAATALWTAVKDCAANPALCATTVGIMAADAATAEALGGATLSGGALAVSATKLVTAIDKAAADAAAAARAGKVAGNVQTVESLFGKTIQGPELSYLAGVQNGKMPEQLGLQVLEQQTGRQFTALQNFSNQGADGVSIDPITRTIYVAEVKSSQNGVDAAKSAVGDPAVKLQQWADNSLGKTGSWVAQPAASDALATQVQSALNNGYTVKGVQVQVGVPAPGATGGTQIKITLWTGP